MRRRDSSSDVTCLAESVSVHSLAPIASLVSQPSQISDQKLTQELMAASRRVGQFYDNLHEFQRKSVRMFEASSGNSEKVT